MAGETRFARAWKVFESKVGETFDSGELKKIIAMNLCSEPRGIISYMKMMEGVGLIKEGKEDQFLVINSNQQPEPHV